MNRTGSKRLCLYVPASIELKRGFLLSLRRYTTSKSIVYAAPVKHLFGFVNQLVHNAIIQYLVLDQTLIRSTSSGHSRLYRLQLDWEDVSGKVLQKLIDRGVNLSEQRTCSMSKHPLVRLCRRTVNGCKLLKLVDPSSISQEFRNRMLKEAVKRGSFKYTKQYCSGTRNLLHFGDIDF